MTITRNSTLLVSGAITTSNPKQLVKKLEGPILHLDGVKDTIKVASTAQVNQAVLKTAHIFRGEPTTLYPNLGQVYDSKHITSPNLTRETINDYINLKDWKNIIIVWQDSSDIVILNQLKISNPILNLRMWDISEDNQFFVQLYEGKKVIAEQPVGYFKKNGRSLNLREAHGQVCDFPHPEITNAHNPCTDVIWTRCIFNY